MFKNPDNSPRRKSPRRKTIAGCGALLMGLALSSTQTHAQDLRVGCTLVRHYGGAEVRIMLERVRSSVGDGEANALHAKYISLKNDCSADQNASRVIHISAAMHRLLDEYGVNVRRFAASER